MAVKEPSHHELYFRKIQRSSIGVALLALIGLLLWTVLQPRPIAPVTHQTAVEPFVATPKSFQGIIGPVTDVKADSLTIKMPIVGSSGTTEQRLYKVSIDSVTQISTYDDRASAATITDAALADIQVGDTVSAFGSKDLYQLSEFTAVKIYKIISS